jgi:hypothetical protein
MAVPGEPRSGDERFLHIEHSAMVSGKDPAARLLEQLESERWLDRLQQGPETALLLSRDGQLAAFPRGERVRRAVLRAGAAARAGSVPEGSIV